MDNFIPKEDPENINAPKSSGLQDFAILLIGFAGVFTVIVYGLMFLGERAALNMSHDLEQKLFSKMPLSMGTTVTPPPALIEIWNQFLPHTGFQAELGILCHDSPNAFAVPGKKVFLTSQLLHVVKTDRGIAFVMAHELGHLHHRDHLRNLGRILGALITAMPFGVSEQGIEVSTTFQTMIARTFDRDQESAADSYAFSLMRKTFGEVKGSSEFFQYMSEAKKEQQSSIPTFLSTHPHVKDRLTHIQQEETKEKTTTQQSIRTLDLSKELESLCPLTK